VVTSFLAADDESERRHIRVVFLGKYFNERFAFQVFLRWKLE
jgi:hypothetical protein